MNIHIQVVDNPNTEPLFLQTQTYCTVITCLYGRSPSSQLLRSPSVRFIFWLEFPKLRRTSVILYVEMEFLNI